MTILGNPSLSLFQLYKYCMHYVLKTQFGQIHIFFKRFFCVIISTILNTSKYSMVTCDVYVLMIQKLYYVLFYTVTESLLGAAQPPNAFSNSLATATVK